MAVTAVHFEEFQVGSRYRTLGRTVSDFEILQFVTLTGFSNEQQPAAFLGATLLSKPILPEQVVSAVKCCLEERR